eukprot:symbB.v1.2.020783.t2/scaffold1766.1/size102418/2
MLPYSSYIYGALLAVAKRTFASCPFAACLTHLAAPKSTLEIAAKKQTQQRPISMDENCGEVHVQVQEMHPKPLQDASNRIGSKLMPSSAELEKRYIDAKRRPEQRQELLSISSNSDVNSRRHGRSQKELTVPRGPVLHTSWRPRSTDKGRRESQSLAQGPWWAFMLSFRHGLYRKILGIPPNFHSLGVCNGLCGECTSKSAAGCGFFYGCLAKHFRNASISCEAERKPQQEEGGQRDLLGRQEPGTRVEH